MNMKWPEEEQKEIGYTPENNEGGAKERLKTIWDSVFGKTLKDLYTTSITFKIFILVTLALFAWYLFIASGLHGFIIGVSIALIPFIVGYMLALVPHPLTLKLQKFFNKRTMKRAQRKGITPKVNERRRLKIAGAIIFVINISILVGVLYLIIPLIYNQFDAFTTTLLGLEFKERFLDFLNNTLNLKSIDLEEVNEWYESVENTMNSFFSSNGASWVSATAGGLMSLLMGFAIGFYLIHDWENYTNSLTELINPNKTVEARKKDKKLGKSIKSTLVSWSKGFLLDQAFIFTLTATLLYFIGAEQWFILALIMVVLNTVPFIGPIVGGVIIVGFLFVNNVNGDPVEHMHMHYKLDSLAAIIIGSIGIFTIQTIESIWWIPKVYNKVLQIHPATILISLALAGIIVSPFVLPIVIPSIAVAKTIYKHKTGREIKI